mgnify:CR=1 FL=1
MPKGKKGNYTGYSNPISKSDVDNIKQVVNEVIEKYGEK